MMTIVLVWLLALALGAFAAREGFDLSWPWTGASGLLVSALVVAALVYFQGSRAVLTAFRDHLVDDVQTLWKRWSVWISGSLLTSVIAYWGIVPAEWKAAIPNWLLAIVLIVGLVASISAQAIRQQNLTKDGG